MEKFIRTLVFTDFHGDLQAMAKSFAGLGLINYTNSDYQRLKDNIADYAIDNSNPVLDNWLVPQPVPTRLVVLGDYSDRNLESCHLISFLKGVKWQDHQIFPVFLMGNHDLLNLIFFTNPFKFYELYRYAGIDTGKILEFLDSMQVYKSYDSLIALHDKEILQLQNQFIKKQKLELDFGSYSILLKTSHNYLKYHKLVYDKRDISTFNDDFQKLFGLDSDKYRNSYPESIDTIRSRYCYHLGELHQQLDADNFYTLSVPKSVSEGHMAHYREMYGRNIFTTEIKKDKWEMIPVDWRIISYVWRKHYGQFYKNLNYLFLENNVLFVHGGLTPQAMVDSLTFAPLFDLTKFEFKKELRWGKKEVIIDSLVKRTNRLVMQVITQALADYSFDTLTGAEIIDVIGYSRAYAWGTPDFGGILWSDFRKMKREFSDDKWKSANREQMVKYYTGFHELTNISKIICGHTQYVNSAESNVRFRIIPGMEATGIQYICIDNGCSYAYRDNGAVANGVALDTDANLTTPKYDPNEPIPDDSHEDY